jgi:hypothetical protein
VRRTDLEAKLEDPGYEPGDLSSDPRYRAWHRPAKSRRTEGRTIWIRQDDFIVDEQADSILADAAR